MWGVRHITYFCRGRFLAGPGIYYLHSDKTGVQIEIWDVGNKNADYGELSALLKGQFIIRQSPFAIKGSVASL